MTGTVSIPAGESRSLLHGEGGEDQRTPRRRNPSPSASGFRSSAAVVGRYAIVATMLLVITYVFRSSSMKSKEFEHHKKKKAEESTASVEQWFLDSAGVDLYVIHPKHDVYRIILLVLLNNILYFYFTQARQK